MTALRLFLMLLQMGGGGPTINMPMPDPVRISGIPLPAPDLPPGSIRVRVVRDEITAVVPGATVELVGTGDSRKGVADQTGHVQFDKLKREVTYQVVATFEGKRIESRPFAAPRQGGLKFMLVGKAAGQPPAGEVAEVPSGAGAGSPGEEEAAQGPAINPLKGAPARPDEKVPAGTVEVGVVGADGKPLAHQAVTLVSVTEERKTNERHATTDAAGRAHFDKVAAGGTVGYMVATKIGGAPVNSAPFKMPNKPGLRVELKVFPPTQDASHVVIGQQSHIAMELGDGQVNVMENLVLENRGDGTYDPGPAGIFFGLPSGFTGAQAAEEAGPRLQILENQGVAWKGPVPPGRTMLRFGYVLPISSADLTFRQPMPVAMDGVRIIIERIGNLEVEGPTVKERADREMSGRKFWLVGGEELLPAGNMLDLTLHGLPAIDRTGPYAALGISLCMVLVSILLGRSPPPARAPARAQERGKLEDRRERLMQELVTLEQQKRAGRAEERKYRDRREELIGSLERIYQSLDAEA